MEARATKELQELEEKYKWFQNLGSDEEIRASRKKYDPTPKGLLSSLGRFATRKFRGQTNEEYEENAMRNMLGNMGLGANDINEYFADDVLAIIERSKQMTDIQCDTCDRMLQMMELDVRILLKI